MSKPRHSLVAGRIIRRDDKPFIRIERTVPDNFCELPASPSEIDYLTHEIVKFLNANADRLARGYREYLNSEDTQ